MESVSTQPEPQAALSTATARKRALITAPPSVDTREIRELLLRQGVDSFTAEETALPGCSLSQSLLKAMVDVDLVVALLHSEHPNDNAFFELGVAQALEKRILLLVDADEVLGNSYLRHLPYLRMGRNGLQTVAFGIAQVLGAPPPRRSATEAVSQRTRPLGPIADELLAQLRLESGPDGNQALEGVIVRALSESGVAAVSQSPLGSTALPNIAVWSDDLEPWVVNPLLLATRARLPHNQELHSLLDLLCRATATVRTNWSLLLYREGCLGAAEETTLKRLSILALSAESFLGALRDTSFGEVIRRLRDERVHGRG